jgi:hypothetical protein
MCLENSIYIVIAERLSFLPLLIKDNTTIRQDTIDVQNQGTNLSAGIRLWIVAILIICHPLSPESTWSWDIRVLPYTGKIRRDPLPTTYGSSDAEDTLLESNAKPRSGFSPREHHV